MAVTKPKTDLGRANCHEEFHASLGRMTRNFEMMVAGKLLQSGSTLRLGDLRRAGREQNKMVRKAMAKHDPARTGKRTRRLKGTTKDDESDDEDTAFAMRSMGMERDTDRQIRATAEARRRRREGGEAAGDGDDAEDSLARPFTGPGAGRRPAGFASDVPRGAASSAALRLSEMVASERGAAAAADGSISSSAPGPAAKARAASAASAAMLAGSSGGPAAAAVSFGDASADGGSAFSLGGF